MAQRLVRVICGRCKQPHKPPESILRDAGITPEMATDAQFSQGKGCQYCQKKGFRGRMAIFEIMTITPQIRELIFNNATTTQIRHLAMKQGMKTLYADGIRKVLQGLTTLEEVYRIAKRSENEDLAA